MINLTRRRGHYDSQEEGTGYELVASEPLGAPAPQAAQIPFEFPARRHGLAAICGLLPYVLDIGGGYELRPRIGGLPGKAHGPKGVGRREAKTEEIA